MKFGYITFSTEEQQLVHDVIQQMSQGAIDELGLGKIRDAFSDEMFPGMSTLHRKSKYFVLLPTYTISYHKRILRNVVLFPISFGSGKLISPYSFLMESIMQRIRV